MRLFAKRAIVPVLAALALAATVIGIPAFAQSDGSGKAPSPRAAARAITLAATVSIDLCAKSGSHVIVPDDPATPGDETISVPIWGFALGTCAAAGDPALPGPTIDVVSGDDVAIILHNSLGQNVGLSIPGQQPDMTGAGSGGDATYSFTAGAPGTYLYQASTNPARQVPMGLYGALVVRPTTAGQAYDSPASAYDREAVVVLSEVDPQLNADPTGFDLLNWLPEYWLINGKAYPDTETVAVHADDDVLLRYVNAGIDHHTMQLLGTYQRVIAKDGFLLNAPFDAVAETIPAGQTADMIAHIPAGAADGDRFALYSRQLHVTNVDSWPGGMLTFLQVDSAAARPALGVVPDLVALSGSSRAHGVRISARAANCRPCAAQARLRVRGAWRKATMARANGAFVGIFRSVPRGQWQYQVTIRDVDSGIRVSSVRKTVRVR